jgi:DNA-binding transcriptional MerR regulator
MRIGELARRTGTTPKALRYYEQVGLLGAERLPNGYRDYDERDVRLVTEVRALGSLGIRADQARPFVECLVAGHEQGDDCAAPLAVYRAAIDDLDDRIAELERRRASVVRLLREAEHREEVRA